MNQFVDFFVLSYNEPNIRRTVGDHLEDVIVISHELGVLADYADLGYETFDLAQGFDALKERIREEL